MCRFEVNHERHTTWVCTTDVCWTVLLVTPYAWAIAPESTKERVRPFYIKTNLQRWKFHTETKIRTFEPNCQKENLNRCPCQSGCPSGCPCPEYFCPMTTTALTTTMATSTTTSSKQKTDILVLSTYNKLNVPIITNGSGKDERDFSFVLEQCTEVHGSCSLTWQNRHFIFGGYNQKTQISMVDDCTLKLVAELAFNHYYGGCANVDDRLIYLCFSRESGDYKKCRYSSSPLGDFEQISDSNHIHRSTRIAADKCKFHIIITVINSYLDDILAVGSYSPNSVKAEVLNTNRNVWSVIQDYPYVSG